MNFNDFILHKMKKICHHNLYFHQNRFINECTRQVLAKIPELRKDVVFMRCIRT